MRDTSYFVKTFGQQEFRHKEKLFAAIENEAGAFTDYSKRPASSLTIRHYYGIYKLRHTVHSRMLEEKYDEAARRVDRADGVVM
ncbi:MAG: hypothetical protein HOP19_04935 [Acidobacteria bacterium]|nr:hypothetical protein [Acidobacteriota bacterium]